MGRYGLVGKEQIQLDLISGKVMSPRRKHTWRNKEHGVELARESCPASGIKVRCSPVGPRGWGCADAVHLGGGGGLCFRPPQLLNAPRGAWTHWVIATGCCADELRALSVAYPLQGASSLHRQELALHALSLALRVSPILALRC